MRSLHGLRSQRACCCLVVPPNSIDLQFERSFTSSKKDGDGDSGDVVTDEKKRPRDYYTVEKAAEMAAKETVEITFAEKTRRTIKEAWDSTKHTTQEIKESAKRNKNSSNE